MQMKIKKKKCKKNTNYDEQTKTGDKRLEFSKTKKETAWKLLSFSNYDFNIYFFKSKKSES